jgi:hypothetical protein
MTDSGDMRHGLEAFGDCAGCVRSAILRVVDAKAEPGKRPIRGAGADAAIDAALISAPVPSQP